MWTTSCPEAMGWGFGVIFEKKSRVEICGWTKRVDFWTWARPAQLGLRDAPRVVGSDGRVSIVKIVCVSLSPRIENLKVKKVIKSFVPELKKVVCVSGFLCMWTFYVSVYFTYPYIFLSVSWLYCTIGWGYSIHRLYLCRGVRLLWRVSWFLTLSNQMVGLQSRIAQSAGAVEYTDCISAEGKNTPPSVLIWH